LLAVRDYPSNKVLSSPDNLEIITVSFDTITFCIVYLPPSSLLVQNFNYLKELYSTISSVINLGDINLPDMNWETLSGGSQVSNIFCDLVFDNNLTQLIKDPAHVGGKILDVIPSNDELVYSVAVNLHNNVLSITL